MTERADTTTCEACGLTYEYAPELHQCPTERDRQVRAALLAGRGESWVNECMRRQREEQ